MGMHASSRLVRVFLGGGGGVGGGSWDRLIALSPNCVYLREALEPSVIHSMPTGRPVSARGRKN